MEKTIFKISFHFRSLDALISYISIATIKLIGNQVTEKRH